MKSEQKNLNLVSSCTEHLKPIAAEERRVEEEEKKIREEQERIAKQLAEGKTSRSPPSGCGFCICLGFSWTSEQEDLERLLEDYPQCE